jgi:hypothetical protein
MSSTCEDRRQHQAEPRGKNCPPTTLQQENPTTDSTGPSFSANGDMVRKPPKSPRRWFQFRLGTLLFVVGLCAVAAFLWRMLADALPYREQRRTMALVAQFGGSCQTADASDWHRRLFGGNLQNIVLVDLLDCDKADEYIGPVAGSPRLETLLVGGDTFGDEHLRPRPRCGSSYSIALR